MENKNSSFLSSELQGVPNTREIVCYLDPGSFKSLLFIVQMRSGPFSVFENGYRELQVYAILTGRRRIQGGKRGDLRVLDVDEAGLIKINPLANWTFQQVQNYVKDNNVP